MKTKLPEFARGATNVYRTKEYIVKQCVELLFGYPEPTEVMSRDTYYRRTKRRDAEYEMLFCSRKRLDGKRVPATMYTRIYIE